MILTKENYLTRLAEARKEAEAKKLKIGSRGLRFDIEKNIFNALLETEIDILLLNQGKKDGFKPDKNAAHLFKYLFNYINGLKEIEYDNTKGILIAGNYGIGKTLIMTAFFNMINNLKVKGVYMFHAKKLTMEIGKDLDLFDRYSKGILFIDDLGKEPKNINNYGTVTNPMEDLLTARYENNSLTFATGNLKMETYKENYGGSVYDRMKAMFNVIELKGDSKR